ncbi:P-loop containing nucleoside triphosphate hydrolases superfamily protein [Actinidia rufa]|uniref:P-loop containing nucleoside triphosphate hydrolases superfamily protein n=1 Tax=Actinidia rufa TaxID=165716 RepID=A0A7J0E145_9ERIC|nr:P-loop containing nucleoside triphosphate hydrolases superfamily protein [Actinidia rufa]
MMAFSIHLSASSQMGSRERLFIDLNELPVEEDEETNAATCFQTQRVIPSLNVHTSDLITTSPGLQRIVNNCAFSHASTVSSGFQPFVRPKSAPVSLVCAEQMRAVDMRCEAVEKEEGEWSDAEDSASAHGSSGVGEQSLSGPGKELAGKGVANLRGHFKVGANTEDVSQNVDKIKDENGDMSMDGREEPGLVPKQKEVKGIEASHALKCTNNPGKRPRCQASWFYQNFDPRRQNIPAPITIRTGKETRPVTPAERIGEKQSQPVNKDSKQVDLSCTEGNTYVESNDSISEIIGDMNSGLLGRPRRLIVPQILLQRFTYLQSKTEFVEAARRFEAAQERTGVY